MPGYLRIEPLDLRETAAEHDHIGIENVDHHSERARETLLVARQGRRGSTFACERARRDLGGSELNAGRERVVAAQPGTGKEGLDAAVAAAVAGRAGSLAVARVRERVVAPLAGDGVGASEHAPAHHDAAADPGAEDDAEDDFRVPAGTVHGLAEGKAVGVVGKAHRPLEDAGEVALEGPADEPGRVRVLD